MHWDLGNTFQNSGRKIKLKSTKTYFTHAKTAGQMNCSSPEWTFIAIAKQDKIKRICSFYNLILSGAHLSSFTCQSQVQRSSKHHIRPNTSSSQGTGGGGNVLAGRMDCAAVSSPMFFVFVIIIAPL